MRITGISEVAIHKHMLEPRSRLRSSFSLATVVAALAALYLAVQAGFVLPYQWPAGPGLLVAGGLRLTRESIAPAFLLARPPAAGPAGLAATRISEIAPASPAEQAGLRAGDQIVAQRNISTNARVDVRPLATADASEQLRVWRDAYRLGVRGPFEITVQRGNDEQAVMLDSTPAWSAPTPILAAWARNHVAPILQMVVFVGISTLLLALRASDRMAALAVLALALCAVAAGGPLVGAEHGLFTPLGELMLVFTWVAPPLAFIATAFAILYFPRQSGRLSRRPWLHVVPFVIAGPMLLLNAADAAFLLGADAMLPLVVWDAAHPTFYFGACAAAVAMQVAVMGDGLFRFRRNTDQTERRRIQIAVLTIVPGVLAFAVKDGVPLLSMLGGTPLALPWWMRLALQVVVLLPAFGLAYVVAVHRVFAPATVLRRSVQYALARKTLTVLALLPAVALGVSLVRYRDVSIATLVTGRPLFYLLTTAAVIAALRYRDSARLWLDRHFFREAYDAREILLSLVRGEDLRCVLRRDGALPASRVLPLVGAICAAIEAAHREGVLHRDLKPENILLLDRDASVKVLDFGVAKVLSDRANEQTAPGTVTGTGVLLGTPAYMAPEQLRGQPLDARTDVFSLGVIAYEMLTGELPFGRASLWDIGARQASGMQPLRSPHGALPAHLEPAIARALSVDPAERPASAMAFARVLSGSA